METQLMKEQLQNEVENIFAKGEIASKFLHMGKGQIKKAVYGIQ